MLKGKSKIYQQHLNFGLSVVLWLFLAPLIVAKDDRFEISKGQKIEVPSKEFSMFAPLGWEIRKDISSTSLFLRVPYRSHDSYQRNIQVLSFKNSVYIDDISAQNFEKKILSRYTKSKSVQDFEMRDHSFVKLKNGMDAILYYSSFELGSLKMMQAHLLASSAKRHYLVTFTDLRDQFQEGSEVFKAAWNSMTSLELTSSPGQRYQYTFIVSALVLLFALLGFVFFLLKLSTAKKLLNKHDHELTAGAFAFDQEQEAVKGFIVSQDGALQRLDTKSQWNIPNPNADKNSDKKS